MNGGRDRSHGDRRRPHGCGQLGGKTAYDNLNVDALTFRDQNGSPIQYNTGALPKATPLWSPRVGFNWDVTSDQQ